MPFRISIDTEHLLVGHPKYYDSSQLTCIPNCTPKELGSPKVRPPLQPFNLENLCLHLYDS